MSDFPDRRRFLRRAAALAALAGPVGLARRTACASEGPWDDTLIPIIDTHQHLWDRRRFRLPWIEPGSPLDRDFLMDDYREATRGRDVVKTVYMEVDVEPSQQVAEAEHVLSIIRGGGTPMVAAVVSGRPASEGFGAYLDRFRDSPEIKGLRQVLHGDGTPPGYCLEPEFVRGIRLLGERGLSFDLCVRPAELGDAARLVDACPDTAFILDHCGNADVRSKDLSAWKADLAAIARRDRVSCKVSGIVASARGTRWTADDLAPIVNHVLDEFGPDRVVFGGDWPVCTLAASFGQWLDALRAIVDGRPEDERRKLFHDNAIRVYRLA